MKEGYHKPSIHLSKTLYLRLGLNVMVKTTLIAFILLFIVIGRGYSQISFDLASSDFIEIPADTIVTLSGKELRKIGGISGIDYDKRNGQYFLISDAGKKHGDGRYYTANIKLDSEVSFELLDVHYLSNSELRGEGVRITPKGMLLTDERTIDQTERSFVFQYAEDGLSMEIPLPEKFQKPMSDNSGFEGLAFSENENTMYIALERAMPESKDRFLVSILEYDLSNLDKSPKEYYYPLQRKEIGNGISEIMVYDDSTLIIIERDWVSPNNYVSIYGVDLGHNTSSSSEKVAPPAYLQPQKLFSFDNINEIGGKEFKVNNIEGVTFSQNKDYLVLVSDNNFGNRCNCTPTQVIFLKIK